jgi:serine/threonine-protein kinase
MPDTLDSLFLTFQQALAGRYSLEREIGRGGMGVVYLAREVRLDRPVAIKLLPPELAAREDLRERFLREARTAARLSHPYIVPIHSVDDVGEFVFYVMAYIDGETLLDRVRAKGCLNAGDVTRIMREVAWALAYAHAQGVVHRDVKPANVLLERGTERALVTDFGIARVAETSADAPTATGEVLGTPEYMSPEQAAGEPLDGRSDLYSLGILSFFALTGRLPFTGTAQAVMSQHITKPAPAAATVARGAPRALTDSIDRCLAKDPSSRFATGEEIADALAPSLTKRTEVPIPVRVFIDRRRNTLAIMPSVILLEMSFIAFIDGFQTGSFAVPIIALAAGLVAPLALLYDRTRRLAKSGYGPEDVASALQDRFDRRREEFLYEFGTTPSRHERWMRIGGRLAIAVGAVSMLAAFPSLNGVLGSTLKFYFVIWKPIFVALGPIGLAAGIGTTAASARWRRLREGLGSVWAKLWRGAPGRVVSQIATLRLTGRAVPAGRRTELAIAMSAEALFTSLPKDVRATLGDVPSVLRVLQERARQTREAIEQLDGSLGDVSRQASSGDVRGKQETLAADLRQTRAAAEARLTELVAALEAVRLDLLRLQAGMGAAESITQDLAAAEAIGRQAERVLAGQREADAAIAKR